MGIQSSINRVLYYAGAFKIANKRNQYCGAKTDNVKAEQPTTKPQVSKQEIMRKRAIQNANNEMYARLNQRNSFASIRDKLLGGNL